MRSEKICLFIGIAPDRKGYQDNIFLFLHKNICCGHSLEAPRRGASNECPQHMFSWRNKTKINIFRFIKAPNLEQCIGMQ